MTSKSLEIPVDKLKTCLVELAKHAGEVAMAHWKSGKIETEWKADGTPVTIADFEVDGIIQEGLTTAFPSVPVISEESFQEHFENCDQFFIVDPIDGTNGFRNGSKEFTINIALVENGEPQAGAVYAPAFDRMFISSCRGELIEICGHSSKYIERRQPTSGIIRAVISKSSRRVHEYLSDIHVEKIKRISSSFKFCLLAAGEAEIYPRFGRTMEWDTAAGHAILQAAGGTVLEISGYNKLTYNKHNFENPDFVALVPGIDLPRRI